jgi:hypothetical protein
MEQQLKLVAGVLLAAVVAFYGWQYFASRETLDSPEELAAQALGGSKPEEQELACARLVALAAKLNKLESRNPAREPLVQVYKESKRASVRATALQGLASIWDYDSMPLMLDALDDESIEVRSAAGQAVTRLLSLDPAEFNAVATPEDRQVSAKGLRARWEDFHKKPNKNGLTALQIWKERLSEYDKKKGG